MSHEHGGAHGFAHPPAEEDRIASAKIVWVGVVALIVFFLGSLAAGMGMVAMRRSVNPEGPPPMPGEAGKEKIGFVEQRLFEHANQGAVWREQAQLRLGSTGWVDREKGVVHIPIERAMDMVEKGSRP
jgi:hypothetical protein